jgi:hypothetical protein
MPYLLLAFGLLLGLFALYRFFVNAEVKQIKAFFLSVFALAVSLALIIMALTGKLAAALGILVVLLPFAAPHLKKFRDMPGSAPASSAMTRAEALEILGLETNASKADIKAAYKKLMMKVHPDAEGSDWMAAKLNQARDILLS